MAWFNRRKRRRNDLELHFDLETGVPQPILDPFFERLALIGSAEERRFECQCAARAWVIAFADATGQGWRAFQGRGVFVAAPEAEGPGIVRNADHIIDGLGRFFGNGLTREFPHVVLRARSREQMIDIFEHGEAGERGVIRADSSVCMPGRVPYVLLAAGEGANPSAPLPHGLFHATASELNLPEWLSQGLSMLADEQFSGHSIMDLNPKRKQEHLRHWDHRSIQRLWSGRAFHTVGDEGSFAYEASYAIATQLLNRFPKDRVADFVTAMAAERLGPPAGARRADRVSQQVLGASLADLVTPFLGPGEWGPAARSSSLHEDPSDFDSGDIPDAWPAD